MKQNTLCITQFYFGVHVPRYNGYVQTKKIHTKLLQRVIWGVELEKMGLYKDFKKLQITQKLDWRNHGFYLNETRSYSYFWILLVLLLFLTVKALAHCLNMRTKTWQLQETSFPWTYHISCIIHYDDSSRYSELQEKDCSLPQYVG